jgi:hypothetical protein
MSGRSRCRNGIGQKEYSSANCSIGKMARDVQDARVPRSAWMRESGPDRIDSNRLMAILAPLGSLRLPP